MPIAILGTGRSGTSLVTRLLNLCGLYLGEQDSLWDPRSNPRMNPTGYWEQREIHALMDRLFAHLGGTWENPPLLAPGWEYDPALDPFYREAKDLIARVFGGHAEWAWKLPKATVAIAFWQRVIPDLRYIICVRNPLDFAQSLGEHAAVSRPHLFAMWQYYNYHILTATEPQKRFVTFYEDYFPSPHAGLAPLLDFVGLPRPVPGGQADQQIRGFCDPDLNHYSSTPEDVLGDADVPYSTRQLYLELLCADSSARDLPLLRYRDMLLPLLQRALIGESTLDGSGAVSQGEHERVKRKLESLRSRHQWRAGFFKTLFAR